MNHVRGLYIFFLFFCCCCIGTVLHESGHYIAGYVLGYEPVLSYGSTKYQNHASMSEAGKLIAAAGGMLVNTGIGTIGYLLVSRRKALLKYQLLFAAIAFFWSREIVILLQDLLTSHPRLSDEQKISTLLNLPVHTCSIVLGVVAISICSMTVFKHLPANVRLSFIIYGAVGSVAGYIVWFRFAGPMLLP